MGCGASNDNNKNGSNNNQTQQEDKPKENKKPDDKPKEEPKKTTPKPAATKYTAPEQEEEKLNGKLKFIKDVGAVLHTHTEEKSATPANSGVLVVSAPMTGPTGLTITFRDAKPNSLFILSLSDTDLDKVKNDQNIKHTWTAFFKSIAAETMKGKLRLKVTDASVQVEFDISSAKDKTMQLLKLELPRAKDNAKLFETMVEPMARMVQKRRETTDDRERENRCSLMQTKLFILQLNKERYTSTVERIQPTMGQLRQDSASYAKTSAELAMKIGRVERKIDRVKRGPVRNNLDAMYEEGGPRTFVHLPQADIHVPGPDWTESHPMINYVGAVFPSTGLDAIARSPSDSRLQQLYSNCSETELTHLLNTFQRLDDWDYNVFEVEKATGGHSLFYTTYALLYKLDLVAQLKIDDKILRNFLFAIEAGYHPNPYHNAVHAADVCQINYYIIVIAGLKEKCNLSNEELLAAVLAGAIHDYDHPGFNNNFHTKTNAYLSTLYNDRSILENHHVSCVFEIVRTPKFDIFAGFSEEQKRVVRDTLIEMVLSTDMIQHGRIFGSFRRRLGDNPVWADNKEDVRLALSMSVKMADVSNCGRPNNLYLEWAKGIANEFYQQGDAESQLCLPISPYMDRSKDKEEFHQGQIAFMNMVIISMFEKMAEFLPKLEFTVRHCNENREYWQKKQGGN